jgi:hypothetical protein
MKNGCAGTDVLFVARCMETAGMDKGKTGIQKPKIRGRFRKSAQWFITVFATFDVADHA